MNRKTAGPANCPMIVSGMEHKNKKAKTEDGRNYYIEESSGQEQCIVTCEDGTFQMPAYVLVFEEE